MKNKIIKLPAIKINKIITITTIAIEQFEQILVETIHKQISTIKNI